MLWVVTSGCGNRRRAIGDRAFGNLFPGGGASWPAGACDAERWNPGCLAVVRKLIIYHRFHEKACVFRALWLDIFRSGEWGCVGMAKRLPFEWEQRNFNCCQYHHVDLVAMVDGIVRTIEVKAGS